jgi:general secretion pathway protein G
MNHMKTSRRPGRTIARAFTLIEIIVVIIIIGVLATLIVPRLFNRIGQAKQSTAAANASSLANLMQQFILDCGGLPPAGSTLQVLLECPSGVDKAAWKGPYLENKEALLDPWGHPFRLIIPGKKNVTFDIVSYGADDQPGGEGDNADVTKP